MTVGTFAPRNEQNDVVTTGKLAQFIYAVGNRTANSVEAAELYSGVHAPGQVVAYLAESVETFGCLGV